jgi:hypothetical protein
LSLFYLSPPFQTFSHSIFFESNCYSVGHAGNTPSVNKWSKGWPPPSPARNLHTESNGHEFPLLFSTIPFFSWHLFELNCYSSCDYRRLSVNTGSKGVPLLSPPETHLQKVTAVSFPHVFIFPMFSHRSLFQLNLLFHQ